MAHLAHNSPLSRAGRLRRCEKMVRPDGIGALEEEKKEEEKEEEKEKEEDKEEEKEEEKPSDASL